jgi:5-(carboxyamino)imidazole ribonucleotide mutase
VAKIAILLGSDSDLPVLDKGFKLMDQLGLKFELRILSAHRTHDEVVEYIESLDARGIDVIIAGAGKAAHLPGVIAALTVKPVIGLPIRASLDGVDALYSIVQMPGGIPVATVGINASDNAVLLAAEILSLKHPEIVSNLKQHRVDMKEAVLEKDRKIQAEYNK